MTTMATTTDPHDPADSVHGVAVPEGWELPDPQDDPLAPAAVQAAAGDGVADEQHADANPVERPEGAPYCWPFSKLPRRQRALFMRALEPALNAEEQLVELTYPDGHERAGDPLPGKGGTYAALLVELGADVEDAMCLVSPDPKVMRTWARKASDEDLIHLMRWYMERFQVGEA